MSTEQASWDQRYLDHPGVFAGEPNAWLVQCAKHISAHARILCIGDGEGRNSRFLAGLGHDVTAVEWSQVAVERARTDCPEVHHIWADLVKWVYSPEAAVAWDVVVWSWVVTADDDAVAAALDLAPGGVLIYIGAAEIVNETDLQRRFPQVQLAFQYYESELRAVGVAPESES